MILERKWILLFTCLAFLPFAIAVEPPPQTAPAAPPTTTLEKIKINEIATKSPQGLEKKTKKSGDAKKEKSVLKLENKSFVKLEKLLVTSSVWKWQGNIPGYPTIQFPNQYLHTKVSSLSGKHKTLLPVKYK